MSLTAAVLVGLLVGAPAHVVVPGQEGAPYAIAGLTAVGAGVYFSSVDAATGRELWHSDGTLLGTGRVADLIHGPDHPEFTVAGDRLFFAVSSVGASRLLWTAAIADLAPFTPPPCAGDCDGDARVSVDELILGVAAALGASDGAGCLARFCLADCAGGPVIGRPTIACLVSAVDALLNGCPVDRCTVDTDCDDGNGCSFDECTAAGCASTCVCV